MSDSPKPEKPERNNWKRAVIYATAIGGAATAASAIGPVGAIVGGAGAVVGCAIDYWSDPDTSAALTSSRQPVA